METWVKTEHPGYSVSNLGRVRSDPRIIDRGTYSVNWTGRILSPRSHSGGYNQVTLGELGNQYIHRIVAKAFIENPLDLPTVNHKDGDKTNNEVSNLEWMTQSDNNEHACDKDLREIQKFNVYKDGVLLYDSFRMKDLVELGFQQPAISRCISGKLKTHKGHTFTKLESK